MGMTYRDAGVDIDAGNEAVRRMKAAVEATHGPEVLGGLGSYGGTAIASILVGVSVAVIQDWSASPGVNAPVWASLTPMILLVLILLIRPSGLFGKEN